MSQNTQTTKNLPQDLVNILTAIIANGANPDSISVHEINLDGLKPKSESQQFDQQRGSYKVLSLDGTITVLDLTNTPVAQISPTGDIDVEWGQTRIKFTTTPDREWQSISQKTFDELVAFLTK